MISPSTLYLSVICYNMTKSQWWYIFFMFLASVVQCVSKPEGSLPGCYFVWLVWLALCSFVLLRLTMSCHFLPLSCLCLDIMLFCHIQYRFLIWILLLCIICKFISANYQGIDISQDILAKRHFTINAMQILLFFVESSTAYSQRYTQMSCHSVYQRPLYIAMFG